MPATFRWLYQGPSINADPNGPTRVDRRTPCAQVFDWFNANGGTDLRPLASATVPGVNMKMPKPLTSPYSQRVRRRRQPDARRPRHASAWTACIASTGISTACGRISRPGRSPIRFGNTLRSELRREHRRDRAPLRRPGHAGHLQRRRQPGARRQLHAVARLRESRRRDASGGPSGASVMQLSGIQADVVERAGGRPADRSAASRAHLGDLRRAMRRLPAH